MILTVFLDFGAQGIEQFFAEEIQRGLADIRDGIERAVDRIALLGQVVFHQIVQGGIKIELIHQGQLTAG